MGTKQTVPHGGTKNTEEVAIELGGDLIEHTNQRMLVSSAPSVAPW